MAGKHAPAHRCAPENTTSTIADSELWLHQPEASARLDRALACIDQPAVAADLEALERHLSTTA
ncbi:hypothetical protein [Synechococcus sp. BA-132 BA5]|uniref:hypothetical protein n=1 Tax=Synechococcus sp. BA-132 BA5 TaxID=3110252 RepID=UPI002B1F7DE8|nr:hypothetical protein [Synechococcus sp. BA-132 BA5]MEA5414881.1 hypothetical protein [Synechococcus sp. BA-132 BA5]